MRIFYCPVKCTAIAKKTLYVNNTPRFSVEFSVIYHSVVSIIWESIEGLKVKLGAQKSALETKGLRC